MEHLRAVLQRLRDAGIQLRSEKCHFAYSEVDFLGHHITPEGRTPVSSSTELLLHFPRPGIPNWDTTEQLETTDTDGQAVLVKLLSAEQHKDRVIREAKDQLTQTGKVQRGQFKNVSGHLRLINGIFRFEHRVVISTKLRKE